MSNRIGPTDYTLPVIVSNGTGKAPEGYTCSGCGKHGCKLWRDYQTPVDCTRLMCCDCAGADQNKNVSKIGDDGCIPGRGDQIGWMVPAVPTPDGSRFWGYTSVPPDRVAWWRSLPTRVQS